MERQGENSASGAYRVARSGRLRIVRVPGVPTTRRAAGHRALARLAPAKPASAAGPDVRPDDRPRLETLTRRFEALKLVGVLGQGGSGEPDRFVDRLSRRRGNFARLEPGEPVGVPPVLGEPGDRVAGRA